MTVVIAIASAVLSGLLAAGPESQPAERPIVAVVLGKPVYLDEIQPSQKDCDSRRQSMKLNAYVDWLLSEPGRRLLHAVGLALCKQYIAKEHLQATPDEISDYHRAMHEIHVLNEQQRKNRLRRIEQELTSPSLSPQERADLEKDRQVTEDLMKAMAALKALATHPTDAAADGRVAKAYIELWKFNKSLHAKYGGRVIWQQDGIEALDATRRWLEDAEKAGDFKILSEDLRESFYASFLIEYTTVKAAKPFETPWWLEPPRRPEPIRFGTRSVPPEPLATETRPH